MSESFGKVLNEHSEGQYLKLEQQFLNLYNLLESLLTITEGEDLESDSQRLIHFNALCSRIHDGVERFSDIAQGVRHAKFRGEQIPYPKEAGHETVIYATKTEVKLMIEALEHLGRSYPDLICADQYLTLATDLTNREGVFNGKAE